MYMYCMYVCVRPSLVGALYGCGGLLCDSAAGRGRSGVGLADGQDQQVGVGQQRAVHQNPRHVVVRYER